MSINLCIWCVHVDIFASRALGGHQLSRRRLQYCFWWRCRQDLRWFMRPGVADLSDKSSRPRMTRDKHNIRTTIRYVMSQRTCSVLTTIPCSKIYCVNNLISNCIFRSRNDVPNINAAYCIWKKLYNAMYLFGHDNHDSDQYYAILISFLADRRPTNAVTLMLQRCVRLSPVCNVMHCG